MSAYIWVLFVAISGKVDQAIIEKFKTQHQCIVAGNKSKEFFTGFFSNNKIKYECLKIKKVED
jgi:hypothetical protein